jgi:hypothetical protein
MSTRKICICVILPVKMEIFKINICCVTLGPASWPFLACLDNSVQVSFHVIILYPYGLNEGH